MNASEMTFGIEIETTIPVGTLEVGYHGQGRLIPGLPGWKADADPSIHARRGYQACEFVSPIYRGVDGLRQLLIDIKKINELGAKVNASCGLHIHVGFDMSDRPAVERLATLVSNFEKAIYASTGTKNRERGRWCGGLNRYGSADRAMQSARHNRYHVLNLASHHPTVEFRAFGASLNPQKIIPYIRMCLGLVERALNSKKVAQWTAKTPVESSPIHRSGERQTALTRLFYQLGWTKGRQPKTFGDISGEGLPNIARGKKELMRLARKYDGQQ
ncbi:MAG: amidoligase family protein [Phycisphaerae bacterium]|nr:amidoligase family protein [Phycisphaerae bacterium]